MSTMDEMGETLKDQTILVSGATGFMGKVLVEKLLRCVQLKHLYLLVRPRKGLTPHQRMQSILSSPIFAEVKATFPDVKSLITIIDSDLSVSGLGLSPQDAGILTSQVNVVFHAAANVKFDEPLKDAFDINVRGTKELLLLAKKMEYLKAFVHVSTAYSQCHLKRIDEKLYDMPIPYDKLENILDSLDQSIINYMTPKLLGKWPNTYCFTKALAECVVADFVHDLPIAIFRPGIVGSCDSEPLPGWVDNFYGPNGLVVGAYSGVIHVSLTDGNAHANLVPCDMADNALIAVAAKLIQTGKEKEVKVYNYVSRDNPITYNDKKAYLEKYGFGLVSLKFIWVYFLYLTKHRWLYLILSILFHYIPALIIDTAAWITGMKIPTRSFWQLYRRIDKSNFVMEYFSTNTWDWETTNVRQLWTDLSKKDKDTFRFDIGSLDWDEYFLNMIKGTRVFLLKDDMSTLPVALKKYKKFNTAHQCLKIVILIIILKILFSISFVSNFIYQLVGIQ